MYDLNLKKKKEKESELLIFLFRVNNKLILNLE